MAKGRFALNDLDEKLVEYLPGKPGFFLEIGGNDGFTQSNTKALELYKGWAGVLVEPFEGNFKRMSRTRSKSCHLVHAACVPFGYGKETVEFTFSDLMSVANDLDVILSDADSHIDRGRKWLKNNFSLESFSAPARTVNEILLEVKAPQIIDFFSLDVEGAEFEVLKGVDHEAFRFTHLLVETGDLSRMTAYLGSIGYQYVDALTDHDFLFKDVLREAS